MEILAAELFCPQGADVELATDDDGMIVKEIMRTGEWGKTPSSKGVIRKPLKVIRDGKSSREDRIIALSDLVQAFEDKAFQYVTIPLSDETSDHKNLTKLNTGFVKRLFIEDLPNGVSKLKAALHFTEPDVRAKVERGTIPDVSAGVYFDVETPDSRKFDAAINHVCLTIKPFMDGLNPFGALMSDEESAPQEVEGFVPPVAVLDPPAPEASEEEDEEPEVPAEPEEPQALTFDPTESTSWQRERLVEAIGSQLKLDTEKYIVSDMGSRKAIVKNKETGTEWIAPFELSGDGVIVAQVSEWERREGSGTRSEQPEVPSAAPDYEGDEPADDTSFADLDPLARARKLRELRSGHNSEGGEVMGRTNDPLEGVDLSDPEAVRAAFADLSSQNQSLRATSRESQVGERIEELKGMGFAEEPGFLRNVRDILLSDDDEPAVVLLSRDEEGKETGQKQNKTATEIVDLLLSSLRTNDEGKILLAGQHSASADDTPPPEDENADERPVEERTQEVASAIGVDLSNSDTGKEA